MLDMRRVEHSPSPVLWFGNVPETCSEETLWDFIFTKTGTMAKRIHQGKREGRTGWAFVEFEGQSLSDKVRHHAWGTWDGGNEEVVVRLGPVELAV